MTQVKICGITNPADGVAAAQAGADLLGFIFYPPSPRSITPRRAQKVIEQARRVSPVLRAVGVFVDEHLERIRRIADRCRLNVVQLHGGEPPEAVEALIENRLDVFKAFRVRDGAFLEEMERYRPTAFLLDAYVGHQHGGTGHTFDWELAVAARPCGPILLAGGLTPENVARAVNVVHPWGVDAASGVEARPGRKDHHKLELFVAAAKGGMSDERVRSGVQPPDDADPATEAPRWR